jgi:hypothetical protein
MLTICLDTRLPQDGFSGMKAAQDPKASGAHSQSTKTSYRKSRSLAHRYRYDPRQQAFGHMR